MKKILVLFSLISFPFMRGMENLNLRQRVNDIADQYRFVPSWVETYQVNQAIMRELSHELAFPQSFFVPESQKNEDQVNPGGQLGPSTMQQVTDYDHHDDNHFEVDRQLESLQSQSTYHLSDRSSVPNPEAVRGWIYKDEWIFPFVGAPDMANDSEINRFKKQLETHDAAALSHEITSQQSHLKNCSFIDRMNRYKISRRLSFIAKHVRQNPAMHYLLLIHKANRLEDACFGLEQLRYLLDTRRSIEINGQDVTLNNHKISEIINAARRLIEQRTDYQEEKRKYPEATIGGQLLNQSPILTKLETMLSKKIDASNTSLTLQQSSIDPFTDVLTGKVTTHLSVDPQIALTDLQAKVTANPATDFHTYVQQVEQVITTLKQSGEWTAETAILLTKGFAQGAAEHIKHTVQHPIEYAQNFVHGNIRLVKELGLLTKDLLSAPDDFIFVNEYELQQYQETIQRRSDSIAHTYHTLCEIIPQMSREDWGRISGQLFIDYFILKGAGKGLDIVKNAKVSVIIKENPLLAKIHTSLEQALLKHPEMVTAEGIAVKGTHEVATEQSLLQTMSNDAQKVKKLQEVSKTVTREVTNEASDIIKVSNMKEFFTNTDFGKILNENSIGLKQIYDGARIYKVDSKINQYLRKGYHYYLDKLHYDHLEVFDENGFAKFVLNLNGTLNNEKTKTALKQARKIKL